MAKPLVKRALEASVTQWLFSGLGVLYILIVKWTSAVECDAPPTSSPVIVALWHNRLGLLHYLRAGNAPLVALISPHRDGRLISKCAWYFGVETVSGSTSHRNIRSSLALVRHTKRGKSIFITPDGPRGPGKHASPGVINLARVARLPIVPATIGMNRGVEMDSWDRFMVPLPFSRFVIAWGAPIVVEPDHSVEDMRSRLEQELNILQDRADDRAKRSKE